jgi:hypothetical protein
MMAKVARVTQGDLKKRKKDTQKRLNPRAIRERPNVGAELGMSPYITGELLDQCSDLYVGWDEEFTKRVGRSYVQFLKLKVGMEELDDSSKLCPPPLIDAMWWEHTLSYYANFDGRGDACKKEMLHNPNEVLDGVTRARRVQTTLTTLFEKVGAAHVDAPMWSYLATVERRSPPKKKLRCSEIDPLKREYPTVNDADLLLGMQSAK